MACYDRRILVPYLRDVCSVELLCSYLQNRVEKCEHDIKKFNHLISWTQFLEDPKPPRAAERKGFSFPIAFCIGVVLWRFSTLSAFVFIGKWTIIFGGLFQLVAMYNTFASNRKRQKEYEDALKQYNTVCRNNKTERNKIPKYQTELETKQAELRRLSEQLHECQKLRSDVYDVNIIPSKHRDIHAAYYLYDYFSSSGENDMNEIIQTLLLDEIGLKLDEMIAQNGETLLKQRYQLAMQELQNQSVAEQHRAELQQLAEREQNQKLQRDYQSMIAINQQVTDFFSAIDYFQAEMME